MATTHTRNAARLMMAPSVILLLLWMIVPLSMTVYFSFLRYNLLMPGTESFAGFMNYRFFLTDPAFFQAIGNTLILVGGVLFATVVGGIALALLLDQPIFSQGIVRILVIAPFFVMPTVSALVWKNMLMNPVNGLFASLARFIGIQPIDFLSSIPLTSISLIVAWQWLPFATHWSSRHLSAVNARMRHHTPSRRSRAAQPRSLALRTSAQQASAQSPAANEKVALGPDGAFAGGTHAVPAPRCSQSVHDAGLASHTISAVSATGAAASMIPSTAYGTAPCFSSDASFCCSCAPFPLFGYGLRRSCVCVTDRMNERLRCIALRALELYGTAARTANQQVVASCGPLSCTDKALPA